MDNILEVKNLVISFRTSDGKLQAVRNVSFNLEKGETLAIVGESGSGKSVSAKAILGILASNSIVEGGEIVYDGKDLLKLSENELHYIRGDKIAMIFQDPMSSLNPIVKIGRQLTEAMILKGAARQKESRATFNRTLKLLRKSMNDALSKNNSAKEAEINKKCANFDKFEYDHLRFASAYNTAFESASEAISMIEVLTFEISKNAFKDVPYRLGRIATLSKDSVSKYVVNARSAELLKAVADLKALYRVCHTQNNYSELIARLNGAADIMREAVGFVEPNFFALGYYDTFSGKPVPEMEVEELNKYLRKYLDDTFMLDFIKDAKQGLIFSAKAAAEKKKEVIKLIDRYLPVFEKAELNKKECDAAAKILCKAVGESIDLLEINKDSLAYTFRTGMDNGLDKYFSGITKNVKESKRYAKQKAKYDRIKAKGKVPDWEVVPESLTDLDLARENIVRSLKEFRAHYEARIKALENNERDFESETVAIIDFLKYNASGVVAKVTKRMAKEKAIKIMEEVGIPEPRKRYNQYPHQFSGGMRQRIVIAIALAANPDILICDEPTTALDVTIQSQILELINKLKDEHKLSVIFITHDLGVVANMADRVAVMYAGKIVEYGTADDIFYSSVHPYTWALLSSMPDLDTREKLDAIPGTPPNMIYPPIGDAFAPRNKYAMKIDFERQPPMFKVSDTHYAATWLLHPDAPKVEPPRVVTERIKRMQSREVQDGE